MGGDRRLVQLTCGASVALGTCGTGGHLPSGLDGDGISVGSDVCLERAAGVGGGRVRGVEIADISGEAGGEGAWQISQP